MALFQPDLTVVTPYSIFISLLYQDFLPMWGKQIDRVVPSAFLHTDKFHLAFYTLVLNFFILTFVTKVQAATVWAKHWARFPAFFHFASPHFLTDIRKIANTQGEKSNRIFRLTRTPSGEFPLPVWIPQRFLPFYRQNHA